MTSSKLVVLCVALLALPAAAAETDPLYGWFAPPRDGTQRLNAAIEERLGLGLREVNARSDRQSLRCEEVALQSTAWLTPTTAWFFFGLTRSWPVDFSPASSSEYVDEFLPLSTYRYAHLLPFGHLVPVDPAVRVGDIIFGTDKIAHFFTNGARYFSAFLASRAQGKCEVDSERTAIGLGLQEEAQFLGQWASGIFSFADLEANHSGLRFYRDLCEGPDPGLRLVDNAWRFTRPFRLERWVDPCWDEGFEPSAFAAGDADAIRRALLSACSRWRRPDVQQRRRAYQKLGCHSSSHVYLRSLIASAAVPDPGGFNIAAVCP